MKSGDLRTRMLELVRMSGDWGKRGSDYLCQREARTIKRPHVESSSRIKLVNVGRKAHPISVLRSRTAFVDFASDQMEFRNPQQIPSNALDLIRI